MNCKVLAWVPAFFVVLFLLYVQNVSGLLVAETPLQLYNNNELILVGKVISLTENSEIADTVEYNIKVEEYVKNQKPYDMISVIGTYNSIPSPPKFEIGDRVLLLLNKDDTGSYLISPLSFKAKTDCDSHQLLGFQTFPDEPLARGQPQGDFKIDKSCIGPSVDIPTGFWIFSPLKQFKSGIQAEDVVCKDGLVITIKSSNGNPACVKPETKQKLIERGWGFDNNFLTLVEESDRIITGMVTDVEKYDNGRREVFLGVYEWLKNGTNAGAFLELDDIKNKETSKIDFKRGEKVLLFLKDIDENRGARDIFYTEKILPAKYPISLRDKVFSLVKPEDRGIQTRYQYDENCSKRDLFGDSYMYCTYEEKDARFYVPIDITAELVRNKLLEHVSEKYLQEHFDLKRAYDQAVINGHITPSGQVMEFEYKLDDMTFLYLANISLSYSEVYLYYVPPREIQSLQYAEKMNDLIHSCFEPDTIVVFWDKVAVSHIENGFSPVITGAGPPAIYDRHGNTIQNHEKHFRFWPETGEIECSQGMQELPNKIKMQDKELLIDTTQFLKFK